MHKITTQNISNESTFEVNRKLAYNTAALKMLENDVLTCKLNISKYKQEAEKRVLTLENYMYGVSPFMDYIHNENK